MPDLLAIVSGGKYTEQGATIIYRYEMNGNAFKLQNGLHIRDQECSNVCLREQEEDNYRRANELNMGPYIYDIYSHDTHLLLVTKPYQRFEANHVNECTWNIIDSKIDLIAHGLLKYSCNMSTRLILVDERTKDLRIDAYMSDYCKNIHQEEAHLCATIMKIMLYISTIRGRTIPNKFIDTLGGFMTLSLPSDWERHIHVLENAATNEMLQQITGYRNENINILGIVCDFLRETILEHNVSHVTSVRVPRRDYIINLLKRIDATHDMPTSGRMELRY